MAEGRTEGSDELAAEGSEEQQHPEYQPGPSTGQRQVSWKGFISSLWISKSTIHKEEAKFFKSTTRAVCLWMLSLILPSYTCTASNGYNDAQDSVIIRVEQIQVIFFLGKIQISSSKSKFSPDTRIICCLVKNINDIRSTTHS